MRLFAIPMLCAAAMVAGCGDDATSGGGDATTATETTGGETVTGGGDTTTTNTAPDTTTTAPDATINTDATSADTSTPPDTSPPPDTTPPDITTGDEGAGTCLGILACVVECTTQECFQGCITAADSQDEAAYFQGYFTCLDDNNCIPDTGGAQPTPEQIVESIRCESLNCVEENSDCTTGGTYGAGTCTNIFTCLQGCESNTDVVCQRDCFSASTEEAVNNWFDLNYCLNIECYTSDNFQECAQTAIENPPCSLPYNACAGDAGASAGSAGGGGFTPERRDMDAFFEAMRAR